MAPFNAYQTLTRRTGIIKQLTSSPVAIAGFGLAGLLLLVIIVTASVVCCRRKAKRKRAETQNAAFLTVRGVVRDTTMSFASPLPTDYEAFGGKAQQTFSRNNLTASVILPEKAIIRPDATPEDIIAHYASQGPLPRPFRPFSFALAASGAVVPNSIIPGPPPKSIPDGPHSINLSSPGTTLRGSLQIPSSPNTPTRPRHRPDHSLTSFLSATRDSFLSLSRPSLSSRASSRPNSTRLTQRTIRQIFAPILPDELVVSAGEKVVLAQSFDDGWCVVGRGRIGAPEELEFGSVPAWVFVKPMKGLRSERPVRSSSLGVTVALDEEDEEVGRPRDDIISWSNF